MTIEAVANRYASHVLSIVRIMTALLLLQYPLSKFWAFPVSRTPPDMFSLTWFAGAIELVGGALLLIGLFTRSTAFILSGLMAFAYFIAHAPQGFHPAANGGTLAVLFCFVFLYFAFAGGGSLGVDAMRKKA